MIIDNIFNSVVKLLYQVNTSKISIVHYVQDFDETEETRKVVMYGKDKK